MSTDVRLWLINDHAYQIRNHHKNISAITSTGLEIVEVLQIMTRREVAIIQPMI